MLRTVCRLSRRAYSTSTSLHQLTQEESLFRDAARRFARDVVGPRVSAMDKAGRMDRDVIDGLFANGFMSVEEGAGGSFTSAILTIEELAKVDASVSVLCDVQNTLVVTALRQWASDDVKSQWLPRLAADTVGSFCLSEPSSGSDAFAMKARAVPSADGKSFTLNGEKAWITNGEHAGMLLVFANEAPEKGYRGISALIVPADAPGVRIGKPEQKLGIKASSTTPIAFEDVRVPAAAVMGERGRGYKYAIKILNEGRIGIAGQMLGIAQGAFDATMPYVFTQRQQFGRFIGDFDAMRAEIADVATRIEAARLLVYNAARMKENGLPFVKQAAMAKLYASQVAELSASKCVEWCGGVGFTQEYPQEKFYRDAKIGAIYEGTSLIQRATIGKLLRAEYAGDA